MDNHCDPARVGYSEEEEEEPKREREREREFTWVEGDAVGISLKRGEMIRS